MVDNPLPTDGPDQQKIHARPSVPTTWTTQSQLAWAPGPGYRYKGSHARVLCVPVLQHFQSYCLLESRTFAAMAATSVCAISTLPAAAPYVLERTSFTGTAVQGLPVLRTSKKPSSLRVEARTRKVIPKEPLGECEKRRSGVHDGMQLSLSSVWFGSR